MKKTYIRPSFAVFAITTASVVALSENSTFKLDSTKQGSGMDTRKKDNTDMWGNDNSKGIWD